MFTGLVLPKIELTLTQLTHWILGAFPFERYHLEFKCTFKPKIDITKSICYKYA